MTAELALTVPTTELPQNWSLDWAERALLPDAIIRMGIRRLLRQRIDTETAAGLEAQQQRVQSLIESLRESPIAVETHKANEQHYELPAPFFEACLGRHCKYSSGYWGEGATTLDDAEAAALRITCERAQLADGQDILELGCGWGSLTLWMAEHYPGARITAVSNSRPQRRFIEARAAERGLSNVRIITADVNQFQPEGSFDRVVSVEMFEHMRNYRALLRHIASWLKSDGRLFVHIFCHDRFAYPFEVEGEDNWMGRHFFTGGIMPSRDLLLHFQDDLRIESHWAWSGTHYQRTADAWLANLDANRNAVMPVLEATYGKTHATRWLQRWRMFYMACSELWGYRNGREWYVAHYRFRKP